jgi:hypothetical protein
VREGVDDQRKTRNEKEGWSKCTLPLSTPQMYVRRQVFFCGRVVATAVVVVVVVVYSIWLINNTKKEGRGIPLSCTVSVVRESRGGCLCGKHLFQFPPNFGCERTSTKLFFVSSWFSLIAMKSVTSFTDDPLSEEIRMWQFLSRNSMPSSFSFRRGTVKLRYTISVLNLKQNKPAILTLGIYSR